MAWRTANSLLQLITQIDTLAPDRSKASDGTIGDTAHSLRISDHNPGVKDGNIGIVTALDITNDPAHGCDAGKIVDSLVNSRDSRIKYIIWNHRILSSQVNAWKWREYTGVNPHTKHFHVSVKPEKSHYDNSKEWRLERGSIAERSDEEIASRAIRHTAKYRVTSRKKLRLREGPGTEFEILNNLNTGQIVTVLSKKGEWLQVDVEDDGLADGYCYCGYLVQVE